MQGHMAQDGHATLHERIEAPLLARISELEARVKELEDALRQIADLRNLGDIQPEIIAFKALIKKEKP
jgi:hypothetical protein